MTLAEWAVDWPYRVNWHPCIPLAPDYWMWTPDAGPLHSDYAGRSHRALVWSLSDYRVTAVSGGSIWFRRREPGE